jgi:uncharacterized protein
MEPATKSLKLQEELPQTMPRPSKRREEGVSIISKNRIGISQEKIGEFCRHHHIRKLSLFGSVLREDYRPDSDVDVLVEFEPGHGPGFIDLMKMEKELSLLLGGRKVDLVTEKFLNRRIRNRVLADAEIQYASA